MTYLRPMGAPLATLAGKVLRDRAPSRSVRRIGNARSSSADKKAVQWMDSILTPHSDEECDAKGDASPAPAPQPMTYLRPMGGPLAPLAGQVLRDRAPSGSVRRIGNARPSSADKKAVQWMGSILSPHSDEE